MRFDPGVPWPAPPLWRSLYLGLYLVSNPPEKRDAMPRRRVIVALLSSQSVLLSLCSRRPCSPEHKRDREKRENDVTNPSVSLSFFFFLIFFPLFFLRSPFSVVTFLRPSREREERHFNAMSNTNTNTGDDDVADKKPNPPKRRGGGEYQHQKDDSKEETGRDTPRPYATIVGGEGQDFVATTLSTAAQVNNGTTIGDFIIRQFHSAPRLLEERSSRAFLSFFFSLSRVNR